MGGRFSEPVDAFVARLPRSVEALISVWQNRIFKGSNCPWQKCLLALACCIEEGGGGGRGGVGEET